MGLLAWRGRIASGGGSSVDGLVGWGIAVTSKPVVRGVTGCLLPKDETRNACG